MTAPTLLPPRPRSRPRSPARSSLVRHRTRLARRTASGAVAVGLSSVLVALVVLLGVSAGLAAADTTPGQVAGASTAAPTLQTARAGVQVSRDGVTWGEDLATPLWQPDLDWQPGDVRTSTLYVRNDTGSVADLEVVLSRGATGGTSDALVTISAGRPSTTWTTVAADGPARAVRVDDLAPGRSAPVVLRASLDVTAPADTQVDTSQVSVTARLGRVEPVGDVGEGWLSSAHLELAPIFLGFALIVAAVAGRRRSPARRGDTPTR